MPLTSNPLVAPWTGPYGGVPPWDKAKPEHFPEAFTIALAQRRTEIEAIAADPAPPNFENVIAAMERSGLTLERVVPLFGVLRHNLSTPEIQALDREWQPKLAAADDEIAFNPRLFERLEAVYRSLPSSNLTAEQKRLTAITYDEFVRRGARSSDAAEGAPLGDQPGARRAVLRVSAPRCSPTRTRGRCSIAKPIWPASRHR